VTHIRKVIKPTLWQKFVIWVFSPHLDDFVVVKVKGYGIFLVDKKRGGQRMTIHIPWYHSFY